MSNIHDCGRRYDDSGQRPQAFPSLSDERTGSTEFLHSGHYRGRGTVLAGAIERAQRSIEIVSCRLPKKPSANINLKRYIPEIDIGKPFILLCWSKCFPYVDIGIVFVVTRLLCMIA